MIATLNTRTGAKAPSDAERFAARTASLNLEPEVIARAWENLSSGRRVFLVMSGKMGAGKDTLAPEVLKAMGRRDGYHLYYADALKSEADDIFAVIRRAADAQDAARLVSEECAMTLEQADSLVECVYFELAEDPSLHSRSRTSGIRRFLQLLGTDVRRTSDPDYWVKIGLRNAIEQIAADQDVFATDARFPNEVEGAAEIGAYTVRLDINEDTQVRRLLARDGSLPSPEAFEHPSETSLDGFTGYSLVIDNNGSEAAAVHEIVTAWIDDRQRR